MNKDTFNTATRIKNEIDYINKYLKDISKNNDDYHFWKLRTGEGCGIVDIPVPPDIQKDIIRQIETFYKAKRADLESEFERL